MSLLTLKNISLAFGADPLLDGVDMSIEERERICIVGRNGAGKSTLLKLINAEIKADSGDIARQQQLVTAKLEQDVPKDISGSIYEVISGGLGDIGKKLSAFHELSLALETDYENETLMTQLQDIQSALDDAHAWELPHKVEAIITRLSLTPNTQFKALSGGLKRRVLLGRALVKDPDILLLDEPTNHLDITSISWLENFIKDFQGSVVFITHDRAFLQAVANRIIEIDRGIIRNYPGNYQAYISRKAHELEVEETQQRQFDKRLAQEEVWIRSGIKARRTRNEGRVRALEKLRLERNARREVLGKSDMKMQQVDSSGKLVIEAENITLHYPEKPIVTDFSMRIMRGDKIGLIGKNGVGKTTLIKLLLGDLTPDSGSVHCGTKLQIAYFDQLRAQLDEKKSVADNVSYGDQYIDINGRPKHIIGYLQDFLFTPERARSPVSMLSGGERNRLLLARLFSKPANFLVLDEPTNDLDLETLELLEELLSSYEGTLLLVSHDRSFLNNVVTSTLVFEGNGIVNEYVGGYDDWLRMRSEPLLTKKKSTKPKEKKASPVEKTNHKAQQKELKQVESKIAKLEKRQDEIHEIMADAAIYESDKKDSLVKLQKELELNKATLETLFSKWESLLEQ